MASRQLLGVLLLMIACTPGQPATQQTASPSTTQTATTQTTSTATTPSQTAVSGPRVIFPNGHVVSVELASDDPTRAQGLMYRDQVRPGMGMLFFFPTDDEYSFWMKNTLIPLDMIWIDQQKRVVHVKENVPPCQADPCPSYSPHATARYVLEVGAGVTREHGLKAGDMVTFQDIGNVVVR